MALDIDYAAARRDGYSDLDILQGLQSSGRLDFDAARALKDGHSATEIMRSILPPPPAPAKPDQGDFMRGAKETFQQIPQLGYGLLAGAGAAMESAVGEGGIATGFKKAGVKGYQDWGNKIASDSKPSDSFSVAYDEAKQGNFGAMVDWLQHGLGYAAGQGVQMLATAGVGSLVGKAALKGAAEKIASGLVSKEAARIAATEEGAKLGADALTKIATSNVAAKIGETTAIGANAFGQEGGEIFGDLSEKSVNENRALSGAELAKAFGATLAAGGLEFVGDKIGLDVMLGKSALVKPAAGMAGMKGRLARGALAGAAEAPIEGATEYGQTLLEEYGKGNDPFSADSLKQAKDAAALGALAGGGMGGVGGMAHGAQHAQTSTQDIVPDSVPLQLTNKPDPLLSFPDGSVGRQSDADAFIASLPEPDRNAARARLFGYESQPVTPEDVMRSQSTDEAIAVFKRAVEEGTPEFKAQKEADIDAAWGQYLGDRTNERQQGYAAAEQARRDADMPAMATQAQDQAVAQANALTSAQGFDEQQPTALQLAFQKAQASRQDRLAEAQHRATVQAQPQNIGEQNGRQADTGSESEVAVTAVDGGSGASGRRNETAGAGLQPDTRIPAARASTADAGGSGPVRNEGLRGIASVQPGTAEAERALDGISGEKREGTGGLPGAQASSAQPAVINKAKSILTAAGVTGNERMAALRAIRSGENTLDDLIDAHPPKEKANDTAPVANSVQVPDERTAGAETYSQKQPPPAPALQATSQSATQQSSDTASTGMAGGTGVSNADSTSGRSAALSDIRSQNERVVERKQGTGARADFASVERQQSRLESEIAKANENAAERKANQGEGSDARIERELSELLDPENPRNSVTIGKDEEIPDSVMRAQTNRRKHPGYDMDVKPDGTTVLTRSKQGDGTPRKSEAPARGGMRAEDVTRSLTMLRAKWLGHSKVNTVQSVSDLPADVRERAQADDKTEGLYDPKTGQVYLVADNISDPARGAWTAAHEIIGHGGLRALKDKSVNEALNLAGANKFVKDLAAAIQADRKTSWEESHPGEEYIPLTGNMITEESVAELAAAIETDGFQSLKNRYGVEVPTSARNGLRGTIARVLDAVKRFLAAAVGKPVSSVSDADVRELIGAQREAVSQESAAPTTSEEDQSAPVMQSRAPVAGGEEVTPKWAEGLSPGLKAALRKSGVIYTEKTMKQKIAELKEGALKKLQYGILDQFAPIKDQVGKIPYILARMAKNADGTLEAMMHYGRPYVDADGGMHVDTTKKGFIETMQALNGEHERFFSWLAGRRAEQLKKEGRENLFTDGDISALSTLNQGTMKDGVSREAVYLRAQKDVAELNKSVLDIAEAAGLIDSASRKVWQSDFYVPFYRVMEEGVTGPSIKSGLVNQKSIKKLKGGTNNLGDLTQNMLMNWSTLLTASAKNRAAKATLDGATAIGAAVESDETTIRQMAKSAQSKAISYMEDGKYRWFTVEDEHLLAAVAALDFSGYNNQAMKAMGAFKNYLTMAVTASPLFKVRNLIRDSISVIAVSDVGYNPLTNVKNGFSLLRNDDFRAQMVAGGGMYRFGTLMEGNRGEHVKKLIDAGVADNTILDTADKMRAFVQKLWDGYQEIGDLGENVNRAALYEKLRKEGKSHLEASFEARDLMDFGLSGAWAGVRALNQILPFFSARLQGLYKLGRGYNDDPKRMGTVIGAVALASVALMLAYKDDDDFKKRSDADRNNYWWFKVGGIAYRIPRPFEIGAAGSAIEHFTALMLDSENTNAKRFSNQLAELVNGQLAMNPIPQIFRPLIDVYANKDAFSGRPIESMAMQRLRPEDRYTYNTSELARLLSKSGVFVDPVSLVSGTGAKQLSPVQIDSMIRGYFSGVGSLATAAVDGLLHHTVIDRGAALPVTVKTFAGSFAETLPSNSSRYVDMLYSTAQDIEQSYASYQNAIKIGDLEKARGIASDHKEELAKYHMVESLKRNESKITQQIQRAMNSKELTGEQKEDAIKRLRKAQDQIARQFATRQ